MRLSNVRQIISEDYAKEDQNLVNKLGVVLNYFMREVVELSNGSIDFDNLTWELRQVELTVNNEGVPTTTTRFNSSVVIPRGTYVINVINQTNPSEILTSAPFIGYTPDGNGINKINYITGLQPENRYLVTFIVL